MKISPLVVLLVGLAIGGFAFGTCQAGRASDATIRLEAALAAQRDSASRWQTARESLVMRLGALQRDSSTLARQYDAARAGSRMIRDSIGILLKQLPDSQRGALGAVITTLSAEGEACRNLLTNCELRAANAEARAHGDSVQLIATRLLLDSVGVAWHTEQRKNRPGFLGLRSFWRARSYTLPLTALTVFLLVTKR